MKLLGGFREAAGNTAGVLGGCLQAVVSLFAGCCEAACGLRPVVRLAAGCCKAAGWLLRGWCTVALAPGIRSVFGRVWHEGDLCVFRRVLFSAGLKPICVDVGLYC